MAHGSIRNSAYDNVARQQQYRSMSAHERHARYMRDYVAFYGGGATATRSADPSSLLEDTDLTALKRGHRFVRTEQDDAAATTAWEVRLARRYYERLFKEYCIADLSRYKESMLGLRWRTEKEVVVGKGQFVCGAKGCEEKLGLCSYEVNFAYVEAGQKKQALVKLRVCPSCTFKLNYKREKAYRKAASGRSRRPPTPSSPSSSSSSDDGEGDAADRATKRARLAAAEQLLRRVAAGGAVEESGSDAAPLEAAKPSSLAPPPFPPRSVGGSSAVLAGGAAGQQQQQTSVLPGDDRLWEQKPAQEAATTAEEDFDQYFEGLFV